VGQTTAYDFTIATVPHQGRIQVYGAASTPLMEVEGAEICDFGVVSSYYRYRNATKMAFIATLTGMRPQTCST
jgi:hypothetical protein